MQLYGLPLAYLDFDPLAALFERRSSSPPPVVCGGVHSMLAKHFGQIDGTL